VEQGRKSLVGLANRSNDKIQSETLHNHLLRPKIQQATRFAGPTLLFREKCGLALDGKSKAIFNELSHGMKQLDLLRMSRQ
jgi:hypothetical protein